MVKVFIIEDEKDIADIIALALEKRGYSTIVAYDGEEAARKLTETRPDVVVLDLMLPKIDGQTLGAQIKANPATADVPVIVITAHAKIKELMQSKSEFNVAAYLEKPFPVATLLEKIEEVMS